MPLDSNIRKHKTNLVSQLKNVFKDKTLEEIKDIVNKMLDSGFAILPPQRIRFPSQFMQIVDTPPVTEIEEAISRAYIEFLAGEEPFHIHTDTKNKITVVFFTDPSGVNILVTTNFWIFLQESLASL